VERHCTTIAANLQARHGRLQRFAARVPDSIARLQSSFDNHQTRDAHGFGTPFDSMRPLLIVGGPKQSNEAAKQSNKAGKLSNEPARQSSKTAKQSNEAAKQTSEAAKQSNKAGKQSNKAGKLSSEAARQTREAAKQSNEATQQSNIAPTQPSEARKPTTSCLRIPSAPNRRWSERSRQRTRMLLRCVEARVQCPVQRAQCCPAKHPDGYIEALF